MIIVTGMHRSGTSCIAGLLVQCGFDLGTSHPLLNEKAPENPRGHHENLSVISINDFLLKQAGGSWNKVPDAEKVLTKGAHIVCDLREFNETFTGNLIKDPRFCLTLPLWEHHCPRIDRVVFCLRNPVGVALSLRKREAMSLDDGLKLWYDYNYRFLYNGTDLPVTVVDYDMLHINLKEEMQNLLKSLKMELSPDELLRKTNGFYDPEFNHDNVPKDLLESLPSEIKKMYQLFLSQTYSYHRKQETA